MTNSYPTAVYVRKGWRFYVTQEEAEKCAALVRKTTRDLIDQGSRRGLGIISTVPNDIWGTVFRVSVP